MEEVVEEEMVEDMVGTAVDAEEEIRIINVAREVTSEYATSVRSRGITSGIARR